MFMLYAYIRIRFLHKFYLESGYLLSRKNPECYFFIVWKMDRGG